MQVFSQLSLLSGWTLACVKVTEISLDSWFLQFKMTHTCTKRCLGTFAEGLFAVLERDKCYAGIRSGTECNIRPIPVTGHSRVDKS